MDFVLAAILGVIEGLTEFLPISSTGHLLVASALLNFPSNLATRDAFDIFIQLGAVIAVIVYYARSLMQQAQQIPSDKPTQRFWLNILIAFLPAAIVGLIFEKQIDRVLQTPLIIGIALLVGGIIFLLVERGSRPAPVKDVKQVTPGQALGIGIAQVVSLIPGVSRSGATIVGGLLLGLDRLTATTFSFYLFIPTLGAATLYKLYSAMKAGEVVSSQLPLFVVGTVVAFIVAYISIVWLLRYISTHTFRAFGIYRIIAGVIVIFLAVFTTLLH